MKKRKTKSSKKFNIKNKKFWRGFIAILLMIGAVMTAVQTSFFGVAIGVLIGFLVSTLFNKI